MAVPVNHFFHFVLIYDTEKKHSAPNVIDFTLHSIKKSDFIFKHIPFRSVPLAIADIEHLL